MEACLNRRDLVRNKRVGYTALMNLQNICDTKGWKMSNLDEHMTASARFVPKVNYLFDTEAEMVAAKAQRQVLCQAAGVPMCEWAQSSLTMYVNALAALHKLGRPQLAIVPKAKRQFPVIVRFCDAAASRAK